MFFQRHGISVPSAHDARIKVFSLPMLPNTLALLERFGGTYVSTDTLLLRDFSPLFGPGTAFFYRWSTAEGIAPQVMYTPCHSPLLQSNVLDGANRNAFESTSALFYALRTLGEVPAIAKMFTIYSSTLFDPLWMREDNAPTGPIFAAVNPELQRFNDFFTPRPNIAETDTFFPAAFAISGHGPDASYIDLPEEGSWAAVLLGRFTRALEGKVCK